MRRYVERCELPFEEPDVVPAIELEAGRVHDAGGGETERAMQRDAGVVR